MLFRGKYSTIYRESQLRNHVKQKESCQFGILVLRNFWPWLYMRVRTYRLSLLCTFHRRLWYGTYRVLLSIYTVYPKARRHIISPFQVWEFATKILKTLDQVHWNFLCCWHHWSSSNQSTHSNFVRKTKCAKCKHRKKLCTAHNLNLGLKPLFT